MNYEPKRAPDQPAPNDSQYKDAMKRYATCPVCGKGERETSETWWPVSHLACVDQINALLKISFDIEAPENAGYDTYEEWVVALKEYQCGEGVDYERRGKGTP